MIQAAPLRFTDCLGRETLHSLGFHALGCEVNLWLAHSHASIATRALARARSEVERLENTLSRFRTDSELSILNANPGRDVAVSQALWSCLTTALDGAQRTGGLYDPTILDALEAAGYDRTFPDLEDRRAESGWQPSIRPGWQSIRLDHRTHTVRLPRGVRLDLGGVGKSWIAERVADQLERFGPCLVDAGGDIAVRGAPPSESGWIIGVADPRCPERDLALLTVVERAVATSGIDYRRWTQNGADRHHIIDPRVGEPARTDLLSITVLAPSADEANVYTLAALIRGSTEGQRYLEQQRDVEGLLVRADGKVLRTRGFAQFEISGASA
jgi:thiamine biosynthesis lipoprotein